MIIINTALNKAENQVEMGWLMVYLFLLFGLEIG
jgi:hypothetical protein